MSTTSNTTPDTTSVVPVPETEPVKLMSEIMSELIQVNFVDNPSKGFCDKLSSTESSSTKSSSIELPNIKTDDDLYTFFKGLIINQVINRKVPFEDDSFVKDLIDEINREFIILWKSYPKKSLRDFVFLFLMEDKVPISVVAIKSTRGNYYVPRILIMMPKDIDPTIDQSKFNLQYIREFQAAQLSAYGFSSALEAAETFDDLDACVESYN